ncbi:hypothetical protein PV08_09559 [Exophiala spinifera]|uniref:Cytochrome P450 n=1 Tax=Exophiala spinifera TaxID=91928 RepID=A0A0D1ZH69_9EURO|nr:uncharacterized protein PV08_09559 [Exophiala spinifera]KIW12282.1 hypothetical protein PV08_09559 [Exophiala spinifera]
MVSRLTQSFSFHSSPESFISARLGESTRSDGDALPLASRIVRAQILNREVHIVTSYHVCKAILCHQPGAIESVEEASLGRFDASKYDSEYAHVYAQGRTSISRGGVSPQRSRKCTVHAKNRGRSDDKANFFAARTAYRQFMGDFFPGSNLLLEDGLAHKIHKAKWRTRLDHLPQSSVSLIRQITESRFLDQLVRGRNPQEVDLYASLKSLVWDILFGVFLSISRDGNGRKFKQLEELQEALLRGQFSTFPVSISTPLWSSTRSRGLQAVEELEKSLATIARDVLASNGTSRSFNACPFSEQFRGTSLSSDDYLDTEDIVSHLRLFTSSIANKALASLLTAFILNLFVWRPSSSMTNTDEQGSDTSVSLAELIRSYSDPQKRDVMLNAVLAETERLSPPVVGVMRRVQQDVLISSADRDQPDEYEIPEGQDAWLYLSGANRDPDVYDRAGDFVWDRFLPFYSSSSNDATRANADCLGTDFRPPLPFTFGDGVKSCLGAEFSRQVCLTVAKTLVDESIMMTGRIEEGGVISWLGWERRTSRKDEVQLMARDLKQLPTQRPRRAIKVQIGRLNM